MSTPKKSDEASAVKNTQNAPAAVHVTSVLAVPRAWLIGLIALLIVPWMIVGGIYLRPAALRSDPPAPSVEDGPAKPASTGPWGDLTVTPIVISPPIEYVASDWEGRAAPDVWYFPDVSGEMLEAFLLTAGMPSEETARVRSAARPDPRTQGLMVTPDPELVRKMSPEVRTRLYLQLAKSQLNFNQANAFCFFGASSDAWLQGSLISERTKKIVEPFIYHDGNCLLFSDNATVRSLVGDKEELRRLAKMLLRQATVLVRLKVKDVSQVESLAQYWGRGGRRTDLRPLLESVAGAGPDGTVDIIHLLPTFARNHLYRYPKLTTADLVKPMLNNCLYSALNFFKTQPDDGFLDVDTALKALRQNYYVVEDGFELGDIVAFLDTPGDLFHVAVYLADNLVFTKNGTSPVAPYTIMSIDDLKGFYHRRCENPRLIYHRQNDF